MDLGIIYFPGGAVRDNDTQNPTVDEEEAKRCEPKAWEKSAVS